MELTRMHLFLIICFGFIIAIIILLISHIWACSVAGFIAFIALIYMLNDYLEDKKVERSLLVAEAEKTVISTPIDESYPEWDRADELKGRIDVDEHLSRKKALELYSHLFNIDEARAKNLYGGGYYSIRKLSEAELRVLIKIPGINPTIARKIKNTSISMVNDF
jgi:hypothetical protein